jgi:hypothetical protein
MRSVLFAILTALLAGCATTPDQIDRLVTNLSSNGMWANGAGTDIRLPETASTEQVTERVFQLNPGNVRLTKILKIRQVRIGDGSHALYTAVLVQTDLGQKIVLLRWNAVCLVV